MKNKSSWKPSKYVYKNNTFMGSRDLNEVTASSRLTADITAKLYAQSLPIHARGKLLDLGCGTVPLYQMYESYVSDVVCVDWSNSEHYNCHLDMECNLSEVLPLPDNKFDTIILSDVLEHIFEPGLLWREMFRIMAPNGTLIINVPFFYWIHEQPHDYYRYTEFALKRFAEASGFEMIELKPTGGSPEIFAELITKHLQHLPVMGVVLSSVVQFLTRMFINTSIGKKTSEKTAKVLPLGYFMVLAKP